MATNSTGARTGGRNGRRLHKRGSQRKKILSLAVQRQRSKKAKANALSASVGDKNGTQTDWGTVPGLGVLVKSCTRKTDCTIEVL